MPSTFAPPAPTAHPAAASNRPSPIAIALLAGAVLLLAVPAIRIPAGDLDASWTLATIRAIHEGMTFGTEFIWTYGPWAHLDLFMPVSVVLLIVGIVGGLLTAAAITGFTWVLARKRFGDVPAALLVLLVAVPVAPSSFSERALVLSVLLLLGTVSGALPVSWRRWAYAAAAAVGALALEAKFSNGALAIATAIGAAILSEADGWRRWLTRLGIAVGAAVVTIPLFWLLAGQPIAALADWILSSIRLTEGYSDAMAGEVGDALGQYAFFILAIALLCLALLPGKKGWRLVAVALAIAWIVFMTLRLGFTRHDVGHAAQVFAILAIAFLATNARRAWSAMFGAVLALAIALASWSGGISYFDKLDPGAWGKRANELASAVLSQSVRGQLLDTGKGAIRQTLSIDDAIIAALDGRTVHIDPYDASAAFAYDLDWEPIPIVQSYAAFNPWLDAVNAEAIAGPAAPEAILRHSTWPVDGRNTIWESPLYQLALACNYVPEITRGSWQLLLKSTDRCGDATVIDTVAVHAGVPIEIPRGSSNSIIAASFDLPQPLADRIAQTLFKPLTELHLAVDDREYRIPRAHLSGPLIVHLPTEIGWRGEFGGNLPYQTITAPSDGTVTFLEVPLS